MTIVDDAALDTLFRTGRTYSYWQDKPVPDALLREIHDLYKFAPTSANCSPQRVVFVRTAAAKEKLRPCLDPGNVDKTMSAPVCAILGYDRAFHDRLPALFPHADARSWFVGNPKLIEATAFRNGSLQGAYFMLAARAVGLDCGPMSGFDTAAVDAAFFAGTAVTSNFLCNLGYGDPSRLHDRLPRPDFDAVCRLE